MSSLMPLQVNTAHVSKLLAIQDDRQRRDYFAGLIDALGWELAKKTGMAYARQVRERETARYRKRGR